MGVQWTYPSTTLNACGVEEVVRLEEYRVLRIDDWIADGEVEVRFASCIHAGC